MCQVSDEVHRDDVDSWQEHQPNDALQAWRVNSEGVGGNNATAVALSHTVAETMLKQRHGQQAFAGWQQRREGVREAKAGFRDHCLTEAPKPVYRFNEGVLGDEHVTLSDKAVQLNNGPVMTFDDDNGLAAYQINL